MPEIELQLVIAPIKSEKSAVEFATHRWCSYQIRGRLRESTKYFALVTILNFKHAVI